MEDSLVLQLQKDAIDKDKSVTDLLRVAKLAAAKLGLDDAIKWIDLELHGYGDTDLPAYRKRHSTPQAYHTYYGWQSIMITDPRTHDILSDASIEQPIGSLEEMVERYDGSGIFALHYPPEQVAIICKAIRRQTHVRKALDYGEAYAIIDAVRNLVLEWSLELEKAGIMGENMTFSKEDKKEAKSLTQHFAAQNITMVGDTSGGSTINVNQEAVSSVVSKEDLSCLLKQISTTLPVFSEEEMQNITPIYNELSKQIDCDEYQPEKAKKLLECLLSIFEGMSGNLAAQGIVSGISALL